MIPYIEDIYVSKSVVGISGIAQNLHSHIDHCEGTFIRELIDADPSVFKTLEIGCAFGLSSLYICHSIALRTGAAHTIIDPFQFTYWDGIGVKHLTESGIQFFELIEERSEFVLPSLLSAGESMFDLVFIDGWHTFEHALLDCFFSTRLLRTGGYLILDDVHMPSIHNVVEYLLCYPCFELSGLVSIDTEINKESRITFDRKTMSVLLNNNAHRKQVSMVALQKITEDKRSWNWYPEKCNAFKV